MNLRSLSDFFQQSLIESILSPIPTTELSVLFVALAYLLLLVSFVIADCALLLRCYPDHCCRFVPPIFHSRCSSIKRVCYICNYLFRFSSWVLLRFFCCHSLFVNWFILVLMKIPCCSVLLSFSACFVSFYRGRYLVLDHDIYAHHLVSTWRWGWEALPWNSALSCNGKRSAFFNVWRRATTPSDCLLNRDMSQQWLTSACWFAATFVFASPLPQCSIDWFFVLKFVVIPFVTVVEFVATMIFCSFQRFIMIYTVVNNSVVHVLLSSKGRSTALHAKGNYRLRVDDLFWYSPAWWVTFPIACRLLSSSLLKIYVPKGSRAFPTCCMCMRSF